MGAELKADDQENVALALTIVFYVISIGSFAVPALMAKVFSTDDAPDEVVTFSTSAYRILGAPGVATIASVFLGIYLYLDEVGDMRLPTLCLTLWNFGLGLGTLLSAVLLGGGWVLGAGTGVHMRKMTVVAYMIVSIVLTIVYWSMSDIGQVTDPNENGGIIPTCPKMDPNIDDVDDWKIVYLVVAAFLLIHVIAISFFPERFIKLNFEADDVSETEMDTLKFFLQTCNASSALILGLINIGFYRLLDADLENGLSDLWLEVAISFSLVTLNLAYSTTCGKPDSLGVRVISMWGYTATMLAFAVVAWLSVDFNNL